MSLLQVATILLAVVNLSSFAWAMKKFFREPASDSKGARAIYIWGSVSACLTVGGLMVTVPRVAALQVLAVALYIVAFGLFWWAIVAAGKHALGFAFNSDGPRQLLVRGPYRHIRHPFYSSYLLTWIAGLLAGQNLLLIPPLVGMCWLYLNAATLEENQFLASRDWRALYLDYCKSTGRFIPDLRALWQRH